MIDADLIEVRTGRIAHGGHVVARNEGHVIFVRHALPDERVRVRITEDAGRFLRADAVEVIEASPHRVAAPCPLAHADGCGGCDFQHVELAEQRRLKAAVVTEQLQRLAGIDREVICEPVPGDTNGLRWRTRMQYVEAPDGRPGLRKHRSHDVIPVDDCLIAREDARVIGRSSAAGGGVVVGGSSAAGGGVVVGGSSAAGGGVSRPSTIAETVEVAGRSHTLELAVDGFWQVHPGAPTALVEAVLAQLDPRAGERALDLYAGVGLFGAFLADAVGVDGHVTCVESDRAAAEFARHNLTLTRAKTHVVSDRVDRWINRQADNAQADIVVLDPPRTGAKRAVVERIAAMRPRAVSYVACDPAALARDAGYFQSVGYELTELRCFDLFPMTHHVECVAKFTPSEIS